MQSPESLTTAWLIAVWPTPTHCLDFEAVFHRKMRFRSEEHTSELQSQSNLVCRLLLEKKKKPNNTNGIQPQNTNNQRPHDDAVVSCSDDRGDGDERSGTGDDPRARANECVTCSRLEEV